MAEAIMSRVITNEESVLLNEASEMFDETGCVPGIDGEQVPAERIVRDAKEYISETIDDPDVMYDRKYGIHPGLHWSCRGWHKNGIKNASTLHLAAVKTLSRVCPRNNKRHVSPQPPLS